jgi:hypothetical protein
MHRRKVYECEKRRKGGRTNIGERSGGLIVIHVCIEIKIQIDRRISCGEIAFEISIRVFKDISQNRLKAQPKTFYSDEKRKFT